ncbi:fatty acid desaturase family protein [Sphingomonas paeninsulae]|jgi:hypothetical protein|nr:fatty acid desaturase family protein [Sphingomonas paeninsulae]
MVATPTSVDTDIFHAAILKRMVIATFVLSLAANIALSSGTMDWRIIPACLIGWYLADAASGIVHMYMDYRHCPPGRGLDKLFFYSGSRISEEYLELRRSVLKHVGTFDRLVFDFKNHHPRPDALGRRGIVDLIWSSIAFVALPLSILLNVAALMWEIPLWFTAAALMLLIGGALAQYFHSSLHRADVPLTIKAMRAVGLLMTPSAHAFHHATLRRDFATNSGWSNRLLNPIFSFLHRQGILVDAGLEPT